MTEQNQLNELVNHLNECLKVVTDKIEKFYEDLSESFQDLFEEIKFDEAFVLSEKEIKKKIKYAKTPMEVKHWNKILNEKKRRKKK